MLSRRFQKLYCPSWTNKKTILLFSFFFLVSEIILHFNSKLSLIVSGLSMHMLLQPLKPVNSSLMFLEITQKASMTGIVLVLLGGKCCALFSAENTIYSCKPLFLQCVLYTVMASSMLLILEQSSCSKQSRKRKILLAFAVHLST